MSDVKVYGLKMLFGAIRKRARIIWGGNPEKKIDWMKDCWKRDAQALDGSLMNREEYYLNQYKAKYELERLNRLKSYYVKHGDIRPEDIGESGIRKIELGVLNWFKAAWLDNETDEKIKFYLWMEADYFEHFGQYIKSKNAYFKDFSIQNKYEAGMVGTEWIIGLIGCIVTFFVGKNIDKIYSFFYQEDILEGTSKLLVLGGMIVLVLLFLVLIYFGFRTLFYAEYTKKNNMLRQQKETWIRHVAVISAYQKEMLGFLWNLDEYQNCIELQEKEELLMNNILEAWMNDNKKFQSNMNKTDENSQKAVTKKGINKYICRDT